MNVLTWICWIFIALLMGTGIFLYSGVYDIGADDPHARVTLGMIDMLRDRSIAVRADDVPVPENLSSDKRIRRGAGNYDAMCVSCHLKPGLADTELRKGLYPQPPNLVGHGHADVAEQFWVIKHGIKMTAMPAWSKGGMDDDTIWDMVAFLQAMPEMSAEDYSDLVASSDGHSHAGADDHAEQESPHQGHESNTPADHHSMPMPSMEAPGMDHSEMPESLADEAPGHHNEMAEPPAEKKSDSSHHDDSGSAPHAH